MANTYEYEHILWGNFGDTVMRRGVFFAESEEKAIEYAKENFHDYIYRLEPIENSNEPRRVRIYPKA